MKTYAKYRIKFFDELPECVILNSFSGHKYIQL